MLVNVSSKKKPIDYTGNFRKTFRTRMKAKKTFQAEMSHEPGTALISLLRSGSDKVIELQAPEVRSVVFFLDGDVVYAEVVLEQIGTTASYIISPATDVLHLGTDGVFGFREDVGDLADAAGTDVVEIIDPNLLHLCPEEAEDTNELLAMRKQEGADIKYHELPDSITGGDGFEPVSQVSAFSGDVEEQTETSPVPAVEIDESDFEDLGFEEISDDMGLEDVTDDMGFEDFDSDLELDQTEAASAETVESDSDDGIETFTLVSADFDDDLGDDSANNVEVPVADDFLDIDDFDETDFSDVDIDIDDDNDDVLTGRVEGFETVDREEILRGVADIPMSIDEHKKVADEEPEAADEQWDVVAGSAIDVVSAQPIEVTEEEPDADVQADAVSFISVADTSFDELDDLDLEDLDEDFEDFLNELHNSPAFKRAEKRYDEEFGVDDELAGSADVDVANGATDPAIADPAQAISAAVGQLTEIQASIQRRKEEALAEIEKIVGIETGAATAGEGASAEDETAIAEQEAATAAAEEPVASAVEETHTVEEDLIAEELVKAKAQPEKSEIEKELEALDAAGAFASDALNEYDEFFSQSVAVVKDMLAGEDAETTITGLISQLQDQNSMNVKMNMMLKRERAMKEHCMERLSKVSDQLASQGIELDNVKRSLMFSEEAQRKSEKFVSDARQSIHDIIARAKKKVQQANIYAKHMRIAAESAREEKELAEAARDKAYQDRDEAFRALDAANEKLEEEKSHAENIMAEFERQLGSFTEDSLNRIKEQMDKTDAALAAHASAQARVSMLEDELVAATMRIQAAEAVIAKKDVELTEVMSHQDALVRAYDDARMQLEEHLAERDATGDILTNTEAELVAARGQVKQLVLAAQELERQRDAALEAREREVSATQEAAAARIAKAEVDRDLAINAVMGAKDAAISANNTFFEAMDKVMEMSSGIGSRKAKIEAIERAYLVFKQQNEKAVSEGNVEGIIYDESAE